MVLLVFKFKDSEKILDDFKEIIIDLRVKKCEMLVEMGYDFEYISMYYYCSRCNDIGFIGNVQCICYKEKLIKLYYKNFELENIIKYNNFDNFDFSLFFNYKLGDEKFFFRKNMENNLEYILKDYILNFKNILINLLFYGNFGSGKIYLFYCIFKIILDKGYLVVYKIFDELIKNLRDIRFNNDFNLELIILNCDLLIIDDLGVEYFNEFFIIELFNVINKRIFIKKKMFILINFILLGII